MNITKAKLHIDRAHKILGFGTLKDLPPELIENIEGHLGLDALSKLDRTSKTTRSRILTKYKLSYTQLKQGFMISDKKVIDNKELVSAACIVDPNAFGYASENLQKDKELATWVFEKDQGAILAYASVLRELLKPMMVLIKAEEFDKLYHLISPRIHAYKTVHDMKKELKPLIYDQDDQDDQHDQGHMSEKVDLHICYWLERSITRRKQECLDRLYELRHGVARNTLKWKDAAEKNNAHYEHHKLKSPYSDYVMPTWIEAQFKVSEKFAACESKFFSQ